MSKRDIKCYLWVYKDPNVNEAGLTLDTKFNLFFNNDSPYMIGDKWADAEDFLAEVGGYWLEITGRCDESTGDGFIFRTNDTWNINQNTVVIIKKVDKHTNDVYYYVNTNGITISEQAKDGYYVEYHMEKNQQLNLWIRLTHILKTDQHIKNRLLFVKTAHTVMLAKNIGTGVITHDFNALPWLNTDMRIDNSRYYNPINYDRTTMFMMWDELLKAYNKSQGYDPNDTRSMLINIYNRSNWMVGGIGKSDPLAGSAGICFAAQYTTSDLDKTIWVDGLGKDYIWGEESTWHTVSSVADNQSYIKSTAKSPFLGFWSNLGGTTAPSDKQDVLISDSLAAGFDRCYNDYGNTNGYFEYLVIDDIQDLNNPCMTAVDTTAQAYTGVILGALNLNKKGLNKDKTAWEQTGKMRKVWDGIGALHVTSSITSNLVIGNYTVEDTMWLIPMNKEV